MLYTNAEVIFSCASAFIQAIGSDRFFDIKEYRRCLSEVFSLSIQEKSFSINFEDSSVSKSLLSSPSIAENIVQILPTDVSERKVIARNILDALTSLNKTFPSFSPIIELQVAHIVVAKNTRYGSGTTSKYPAYIWLSPSQDWEIFDYAECLYHEIVHLNLFLIDMVYGLYRDRSVLYDTAYYSKSVIKKVKRPIDKSFHSICVADSLVNFFEHYGKHDEAQSMKNELLETIRECIYMQNGLSDIGKQIIRDIEERYNITTP